MGYRYNLARRYFLALVVAGKWTESFQNALMVLLILFCLVFPFGVMTFLWWIGLRGLERIVEVTGEQKDLKRQVEQEQ